MCCTSGCTRLLYFTFPTLLLRQQPGFKEIPICDSGGSYPQSHIYKFCIKSHQNETWTQHKFSSRYIFSHESSSLQENCSLRKTQRPESYKSLALIQIYRLWTLFPFVPLEAEEGSSLCFSSWWHCCTETCSDPTLKKKKKSVQLKATCPISSLTPLPECVSTYTLERRHASPLSHNIPDVIWRKAIRLLILKKGQCQEERWALKEEENTPFVNFCSQPQRAPLL